MTFSITLVPTFLNELISIPQNVFKRLSKATKLLEPDPISADGDAKKPKGYENVYRTRLGDYRLFYAIGTGWVKLLSVRKRNERTYETEIPTVIAPETTLDRQSVKPKKLPSPPNPFSQKGRRANDRNSWLTPNSGYVRCQWVIPPG
jgi:mRNA-degrading endonuclease RelE of RelBE toxin-antitoxin system